MQREPVTSESIRSVGFEAGTLEIEFSHGDVYQYFDVPERVHEELLAADSHGSFFTQHIRGRFRYTRV